MREGLIGATTAATPLLPLFSGVYDNPHKMSRECWFNGRLMWCVTAELLLAKRRPSKESVPNWSPGTVVERYDSGRRKWVMTGGAAA